MLRTAVTQPNKVRMSCPNVPLVVPLFESRSRRNLPLCAFRIEAAFKGRNKKREIPQVSGIWESGTLIGHPFYRFPLKMPLCGSAL